MTTYYERRRLLNEIRLLVPSQNGTKPTPTTPTNVSLLLLLNYKIIFLLTNSFRFQSIQMYIILQLQLQQQD